MDTLNRQTPECPISGDEGRVKHVHCRDSFFNTPGVWTYMINPRTDHVWLYEFPNNQEQIAAFYDNYYTHSEVNKSNALKQIDELASFALGYNKYPRNSLTGTVLKCIPSLFEAAKLEWMDIHSGKFQTVLDFGCGSGTLLKKYQIAGKSVTGFEPDPKAANLARKSGLEIFTSLDDLLEKNAYFDIIILSHVIEHLLDPEQEIKRLLPLLSENGRIIITTPNANSLGHKIFGKFWRGLEPPRHFNIFTFQSMNDLAKRLRLEINIKSSSRLARGIFFQSMLARMGYKNTEMSRPRNQTLKYIGYLFQIFEHLILKVVKEAGEEIYVEFECKK